MFMPLALLLGGGVLMYAGIKNATVVTALQSVLLGKSLPSQSQFPWEGQAASDLASNAQGGSANSSKTGQATVDAMLAEMDRMANMHLPYAWGGGHQGYVDGGPWDCSGAVSQVLHKVGLLPGPPEVSGSLMLWGALGKGKYFTVYANPGHTFIKMPDGRCWGTNGSAPGGGVAWGEQPTTGMMPRHAPGM